jgi:hypothetical protein
MEALSQLSYGPVRKTLNLKGKPLTTQATMGVFPSVRGSREYQKSAGCKALAAAGAGRHIRTPDPEDAADGGLADDNSA